MTTEIRIQKLLAASPEQLSSIDSILSGIPMVEITHADRRIFTMSATAKILNLSRTTIWRMVKDGTLKTVELRAGSHRVPSTEINELLKRRCR